jgi:hypothetical protein
MLGVSFMLWDLQFGVWSRSFLFLCYIYDGMLLACLLLRVPMLTYD